MTKISTRALRVISIFYFTIMAIIVLWDTTKNSFLFWLSWVMIVEYIFIGFRLSAILLRQDKDIDKE